MNSRPVIFLAGLVIATAAFAHQGVENPAVKARMDAMGTLGKNTKVLGTMVKGQRQFDAAAARAAATAIARQAARTPDLFEARESDPKSEALPAIWDDYEDFTTKAAALRVAAKTAAENIRSPETLRTALGRIGAACKACHSEYRE